MKRWQLMVFGAALLIGAAAAYRSGTHLLRARILEALGPSSRLAAVRVNWFSLELIDLSIDAPKGWPAARTLVAERVVIFPDLQSVFSGSIRISSMVIERPYLSVLRVPGRVIAVPSLTDKSRARQAQDGDYPLAIGKIEVKSGTLEFYDGTIGKPPLKTTVERIHALVRDVTAPVSSRAHFELAGVVKGIKRDGLAKLSGWIGPEGRDSQSNISLAGVDLVVLQPYLVKSHDTRVSKGSLDLKLDSTVRNHQLNGKGTMVLKELEFAPSNGLVDTFMGLPRSAILSLLKNQHGAIEVDFVLAGDTSRPNFSLNESLSTRLAAAVAGQLGVSIRSAAEGIGAAGRKGLEGAGNLVGGITASIRDVFGGTGKD